MNQDTMKMIKDNKYRIIKWGIIGFVFCILVVQIPYWFGRIKIIIWTDFNPEDVLGFLGDYLSAVGTVVLGWIAIKQTEYANDINDRLLKIEEERLVVEHDPFFAVDWLKLHDVSYNQTILNSQYCGKVYFVDSLKQLQPSEKASFELRIINTGHTGIYNCKVEDISSSGEEISYSMLNMDRNPAAPFNLETGGSMELNFCMDPEILDRFAKNKSGSINIMFKCINNFGEEYFMYLSIKSNIILDGNRYEKMLIKTPHSIEWKRESRKIE